MSQDTALTYFQQGNQLKQAGQLNESVAAFEAAIALNPDFSWSYHHLAEALTKLGQTQAAIAHYQRAIELDPDLSWSHLHLGDVLTQQRQLDQAIAHYNRAIELNPTYYGAHHSLGNLWQQQGQWEAATVCYQRAIELNPAFSWSHHTLAEVLEQQDKLEEAIAHYYQSIELNPSYHGSHHGVRNLLTRQGRLAELVEWYRRGLEQTPDSSWFHHYLAEALVKLDPNEAIAHYHQATQLNPTFVWSYYYLAEVLIRQERLYEAMRCYRKIIRLQPDFKHIYDNFDLLYYGLKYAYQKLSSSQLDEVIAFHQHLIHLQPHQAAVHNSLGDLLMLKKQINEALHHYQSASYSKLLKSHPGYVEGHWDAGTPQKPDFLIIGTMKSGTTSLYRYLTQHPQILPAIKKEINFFAYNFGRGMEWYLAHFPRRTEHSSFLSGEASPLYFNTSKVAERIASHLPNTKLIVLLRNPVERTISHYYHRSKWVFQEKRSLEESVQFEMNLINDLADISIAPEIYPDEQGYLFISLYVYFLAKWMKLFPKEQLLILKGEELFEKPVETMKTVFDFLGVADHRLPKYQNYFPGTQRSVDPQIRQMLSDYFQPHNRRLEDYLGMQFNWH
ncbi:tetratricopeptide repeat protein [Oscillatoria sp. FACHB-1407]|uniref:tetratricopeptide repeat protein n=1 Tax=Oscillatoria sp. FACHB-1407 TaxID=2692847 RepID=UPI001689310E|nr:tetratricopeptide repeat protein [Oscillatoria sp. FACHB-1407]MBD2464830.1 tetratricopeptide repeat protein [Oscillatoria sp. FACHB-1407]